ncbi:MAG: hypothetical protein EHM39_08735 [Chloroflexi bacterium]|nr:MAG: hypothetical protein EHM39_08735 [Chloroflexota bacterium]
MCLYISCWFLVIGYWLFVIGIFLSWSALLCILTLPPGPLAPTHVMEQSEGVKSLSTAWGGI